jgi:hypothetical protein
MNRKNVRGNNIEFIHHNNDHNRKCDYYIKCYMIKCYMMKCYKYHKSFQDRITKLYVKTLFTTPKNDF